MSVRAMHDPPSPRPTEVFPTLVPLLSSLMVYQKSLIPRYGLSPGQYLGLRFIQYNAPVRISALARLSVVSRPTATALTDVMERKGWIHRVPSREDRRVIVLELTPKAERALKTIDEELMRFFARAFARIPSRRRKGAVVGLLDLGNALRAELASQGIRTLGGAG